MRARYCRISVVIRHEQAGSAVLDVAGGTRRGQRLIFRQGLRLPFEGVVRHPKQSLFDKGRSAGRGRAERAGAADLFRWKMRLAERNGDDESGAFAEAALGPHPASMQLDQLLNERKPDTAALVRSAPHIRHAMKALEKPRHFLLGDPDPSVANAQFRNSARRTQRDSDLSLESEFEGVG